MEMEVINVLEGCISLCDESRRTGEGLDRFQDANRKGVREGPKSSSIASTSDLSL